MAMDWPSPSSTVVEAERWLMLGTKVPPMVAPPVVTSRMRGCTVREIWLLSKTTGVKERLTPVSRYWVASRPRSVAVGTGISKPELNSADWPLTAVRLGRACTTAKPFCASASKKAVARYFSLLKGMEWVSTMPPSPPRCGWTMPSSWVSMLPVAAVPVPVAAGGKVSVWS